MRPVVSVEQMRAADAASPVPVETLIARAGAAVAREAKSMLGGTYGRRVAVVAGKGNNGADGRVAADLLRRKGARVMIVEVGEPLPPSDLIIDAAFGTGFRGDYKAPDTHGAPVLAVDIPSGVNGDTGVAVEGAVRADRTVTFAALKPGLLYNDGPEHSGAVVVADIGLDIGTTDVHLVEDHDLSWLPQRKRDSHKWAGSVAVIAGSPEMMGAGVLATRGAQRAGASAVRWMTPCEGGGDMAIAEALTARIPADHWVARALELCERAKAVVVGPGLGRRDETVASMLEVIARLDKPVIADADALFALAGERGAEVLNSRQAPTVMTPHDAEFERFGVEVRDDRMAAAQELARRTGATVLLKGPTTTVSRPDGRTLLVNSGSSRLATAGSGDVLSGIVGAFVAMGVEPLEATALAAHVHGRAAARGRAHGLLAGDLPDLVADVLSGSAQ